MAMVPMSSSLFKERFKPTCRVKWLKNKGAILIVVWSYLTTTVFHLLKADYKESRAYPRGIILMSTALLYPVGGWIGDTCLGRYKVIRCSMWIMWIVAILCTINEILAEVTVKYEVHSENVYYILCVILGVGLAGFQSNIVQLGIDQLTDASAYEVTSFISWYTLAVFASWIIIHYTTDCIAEEHIRLCFKHLVVVVCLTIAICSDFLFQHMLVKEHIIGKPLRLIMGVLKQTIRNRCLKYSIHSEEELPSRLDVAKHRYGGSFTAQQVENVGMFLWIVSVISVCAIVYGALTPIEFAKDHIAHRLLSPSGNDLASCYANLTSSYSDYIFSIALLLLYEFVIYPVFYRCFPKISIMTTFLYGTVFLFLLIISLLGLETAAYINQLNYNDTTRCVYIGDQYSLPLGISSTWMLLPGILSGLSLLLLVISAFEFIWSQAPSTMKGMILGLAYAFFGLHTLVHAAISSPFVFKSSLIKWEYAPLTCGIWYFLVEGIVVFIVLIIISTLIRLHKLKRKKDIDLSDTFLESST
jgi:peptide/histidine transporter 3/4